MLTYISFREYTNVSIRSSIKGECQQWKRNIFSCVTIALVLLLLLLCNCNNFFSFKKFTLLQKFFLRLFLLLMNSFNFYMYICTATITACKENIFYNGIQRIIQHLMGTNTITMTYSMALVVDTNNKS